MHAGERLRWRCMLCGTSPCSAQQAADDSAQGNTRSEAAQAVALQDFLYWLSSCRCYTWPHMSHV